MSIGYVYCLSNPSFKDTVFKIGCTAKDPRIRVNELYSTGVPLPFKLEFAKKVVDHRKTEKDLHSIFSKQRYNLYREYFQVDLSSIKTQFKLILGEWYIDPGPLKDLNGGYNSYVEGTLSDSELSDDSDIGDVVTDESTDDEFDDLTNLDHESYTNNKLNSKYSSSKPTRTNSSNGWTECEYKIGDNLWMSTSNIPNKDDLPKWTLYPHQKEAVTEFKKLCLTGTVKSGIISHPTGTGKTVTALAIINEFWKIHKNKSVLWITERKDVLYSQFANNKFNICVNSGLFKPLDDFNMVTWYNNTPDIKGLNRLLKGAKPVFLVANTDSIITNDKHYSIIKDRFGLVIVDECHSIGADKTFKMVRHIQTKWEGLLTVGFSATPIRYEREKLKRALIVFGDNKQVNFIAKMTMLDAIDKKIIVPPTFYWIETKLDKKINSDEFIRSVNKTNNYSKIIEYVDTILNKSVTKKAIAWAETISNADEWKIILERAQLDKTKYPALSTFKIYVSHTGGATKDELDEFIKCKTPCIVICVGRCKEGFDEPSVDVGINLDHVQKRGKIVFIQETGRTLRKYGDKKTGHMMDTFTFVNKESKIETLSETIIGYCMYLNQINIQVGDDLETINQAYLKLVKMIKVVGNTVNISTNVGNTLNINIQSTSLKKVDWDNLTKNLSDEIKRALYKQGIGYTSAKKIIKDSKPKPINKEEYYKLCDIDGRLPRDPEEIYKGVFINWIDYLNIKDKFFTLEECKQHIVEYLRNEPKMKIKYTQLDEISEWLVSKDNRFPPVGMWVDYYRANRITDLQQLIVISSKKQKKGLI